MTPRDHTWVQGKTGNTLRIQAENVPCEKSGGSSIKEDYEWIVPGKSLAFLT